MFLNDKIIYTLKYTWGRKEYYWDNSHSYWDKGCERMVLTDISINNKVREAKAELQPNSSLYFTSTSKYPRFKLKDSGFKRVIKPGKCDYMVCLNVPRAFNSRNFIYIYETNNAYYIVRYVDIPQEIQKSSKENPEEWLKSIPNLFSEEMRFKWKGTPVQYNTEKDVEFVQKVLSGEYYNLVTDNEVDKMVNGTQSTLTKDVCESICNLLDSPDISNRDLGLLMLVGFNIEEMIRTVFLMIATRPSLKNCNSWTSVGVQQVLKTINFNTFLTSFPYSYYKGAVPDPTSELDEQISKSIVLPLVQEHIEHCMAPVERNILNEFKIEVKYEVS